MIIATWAFMLLIFVGMIFTLSNGTGYITDGKQKHSNCFCKLRLSGANKWMPLLSQHYLKLKKKEIKGEKKTCSYLHEHTQTVFHLHKVEPFSHLSAAWQALKGSLRRNNYSWQWWGWIQIDLEELCGNLLPVYMTHICLTYCTQPLKQQLHVSDLC